MARGQVLTIPNQSAVLVTTLSREQKASLSVLNPNDGICYVKLNSSAGPTIAAWDWKIPSQSYCQLPGPWESLGVYYLDQSGSGRTAELNVYELDSQIAVPSFIAIGRAVQAAGTTVDISQGSQPANPPASTVRLWADGSGNLHFLSSTGVDKTVIDSTTPLGNDLYGAVTSASIGIRNGNAISAYDSGGTRRLVVQYWSDNVTYFNGLINSGIVFSFRRVDNGVIATVDASGNFVHTGNVSAVAGTFSSYCNFAGGTCTGHLMVSQATGGIASAGASEGQIELQNAGSGASKITFHRTGSYALYLGLDTDNVVRIGGWSMGAVAYRILMGDGYGNPGVTLASGNYLAWNNANVSVYGDYSTGMMQFQVYGGGWWRYYSSSYGYEDLYIRGMSNGANCLQFQSGLMVNVGNGMVVGGTNLNGQSFYCAGGSGGPTGWQIISDKRQKSVIVPIKDPLEIVLDPRVNGYHYTLTYPFERAEHDPKTIENYGFIADEWIDVAPDLVKIADKESEYNMMDYGQVSVILFEAFREYVIKTDARLAALEAA
jgi:hypothetical protein